MFYSYICTQKEHRKIKKVDLINPLKVTLFYEEFNTVVLLDNQMNEIQKIDFSKNEKRSFQ